MVESAEEIWQDALDSREQGDFVSAIDYAKEVVKIEEDNAEAWMAIATWSLPPPTRGKPSQPTLQQSAKSISALRKVVLHEPDNLDAWFMGGRILLDHLGMLEDAIQWWEDCRVHYPEKVTPIIEQIGILVRLGLYEECTDRLAELQNEKMEEPTNQQSMRLQGVKGMVERAAKMEKEEIFRPQDPQHPRWEIIERMKKVKPMSSTFWLVAFIAPIVFIFGSVAMTFLGGTIFGFILVFLLILSAFGILTRLSMGLLQSRNRHALDIDRAIDFETSSGKLCIPESIRGSVVYNSMLKNRSPSVTERLEIVINSGERISPKYQPILPEW
ncbi:MAG: tetratricopeptide repeat protein [Candidatus Thalassarchaeaceae archaeon]